MTLRWAALVGMVVTTVSAACTPAAVAANASCAKALSRCLDTLPSGGSCTPTLPVPKTALPPPIRPVGYNLTRLRRGVYAYLDGMYTALIVRSSTGRLVLVDFPVIAGAEANGSRITAAAVEVLAGSSPSRVDFIYSHAHWDHTDGSIPLVAYLQAHHSTTPVTVWASSELSEDLARLTTPRAVAPNRRIPRRGITLRLDGGLTVRAWVIPRAHTAADVAVHILPGDGDDDGAPGVVHFVGVVFPGWAPPFALALTTDVGRFRDAHTELLRLPWSVFSGGHLTRLGSRADVAASLAYTEDLLSAAAAAVADVDGPAVAAAGAAKVGDPAAPEFANIWWVAARVGRRLQLDACARTVLAKWGCRLAGLDVMALNNCAAALPFVQIMS